MNAAMHPPMVEMEGVSKLYRLGTSGGGSLRAALDRILGRNRRVPGLKDTLGTRAGEQP